jgi:hypothetical protein
MESYGKYKLPLRSGQKGFVLQPRKTENVILSEERYQALLMVGKHHEVCFLSFYNAEYLVNGRAV